MDSSRAPDGGPSPAGHGPPSPAPLAGAPEGPAISLALERSLLRFRSLVLGVGRRHGLDEADLDEVLQEVRIRIWRSRGNAETIEGLPASYLYRTATSAALDLIRRRRALRTGRDATRPLNEGLAAPDPGPLVRLEEEEVADRVFRAVDALIPSRRPVVRMHLAGYDREAIAAQLGWSVGKVRNLLSRGLEDLRGILTQEGIGPVEGP